MSLQSPLKVVFDTDPGVDDALALAFLHAHPGLDLLAVTTVFGNADIETTTRNARYLCQRFGISAPIAQGAAKPLHRARNPSPVAIHGGNGLGDYPVPDLRLPPLQPRDAADEIIARIRAAPGAVTIIAVGPLTNLALACTRDPEIAILAREVILMGGAFGVGKHAGNVTPHAEANIFNDPEAAAIVLAAPWPISIVGLDVTLDCLLTNEAAEALTERAGWLGRFIFDVTRHYVEAYRADGVDGCCLHDVAAVAYAIDRGLFRIRHGAVGVDTIGPQTGRTRWLPDEPPPAPRNVCVGVDRDGLVDLFCESIVRQSALTEAET
ncbi:nucleoside hydrolase [Caulobacter sp. BK020]|uniref:nucleoside hydrolase n=1 Tax=Caulobacter sp. BK020 TaxID=2512117 RepID=UPI001046BF7C|nr:nucleoside hydrolase [Caulobacter sp. BK020]TCS15301.1 inosine-uridine nucleoside N-ribohydrolase [Caulobacter sp. BK020]